MCLGENRHLLYNCTFSLVHGAVVTQILVHRVQSKALVESNFVHSKGKSHSQQKAEEGRKTAKKSSLVARGFRTKARNADILE
jgi:hypothetical protein